MQGLLLLPKTPGNGTTGPLPGVFVLGAHVPKQHQKEIVMKIELIKNPYIAPIARCIIKDSAAKWHGTAFDKTVSHPFMT